MYISVSICSPVIPLYKISLPVLLKPLDVNILPNSICFEPLLTNAVQSWKCPFIAPTLLYKHSTKWPIVILLGIACGFTNMSGLMPSDVYGMSSSDNTIPIVPFCPARLHTLSPISGTLKLLILTLAILSPRLPNVINDLSTIPIWPRLGTIDASLNLPGLLGSSVAKPINIVFSLTIVPSFIIPCSLSNLV